MGGPQVAAALRSIGATVITQHELVARGELEQDALDEEWLRLCGKNAWAVITKDDKINERKIEREAFEAAGIPVFVWKGHGATGPDMSAALAAAYPQMLEAIRKWLPPFMCRIGRNSKLTPIGTPKRRGGIKRAR